MAAEPEPVPIHPVAPRLTAGPKKPHVGPDIHAYKAAHGETVGYKADEWWAKVSI
jgi:acetyl-CoA synthetase